MISAQSSVKPILNRRRALKLIGVFGAAPAFARLLANQPTPSRKMTIDLICGMIGVQANQREAVDLAHRHGFESVEAKAGDLARMTDGELQDLQGEMKAKKVVFGASGLPVEFRQEEEKFTEGLKSLPSLAAGLQRAGAKRVGTWLRPGDPALTYLQNFKRHTRRLREVAKVLDDHGLRLGLEYVGTKTLRDRIHFEFIHTMAETKELIAEIGMTNVGFVLDSWHWWNANETADDIRTLKATDIVAVDLNDAPSGIPKDQQMDGRRELPMATGVIEVGPFLKALQQLGYDGPVRAEPFSQTLNSLNNDEACAKTAEALRKAFALIGG